MFFIQSVSVAGHNHFRLTVEMVTKMLNEEQDEEDEEALLGLDSGSYDDLEDSVVKGAFFIQESMIPGHRTRLLSSKKPSPKRRRKNKL